MSNRKKSLKERAEDALWSQFLDTTKLNPKKKGRVDNPTDNFLTGVETKLIELQHKGKAGNEWPNAIRSVRSSAALAANAFGRWLKVPEKITLLGLSGFQSIELEKKCPTGLGGTSPHLDVLLESPTDVVGIESKLLEPLDHGSPGFPSSYARGNLSCCEESWWELLEKVRLWTPAYFNAAQIIKHYIGLRYSYRSTGKKIHLLYLYWEPSNAHKFLEYRLHSQQVEEINKRIKASAVDFTAMTYPGLWTEWGKSADNDVKTHAQKLRHRYQVTL